MFFSRKRRGQDQPDTDTHTVTDDRDLVALLNEARDPNELRRATQLARLRRSA